MAENPITFIIAVAATFLAAGLVKGVTGMGLPTMAMGVLGSLMSPLLAATLLLIPSFVTNVWQVLAGPRFGALLRRLWPMMLAIIIGTLTGSSLLSGGDTHRSTAALGVALVVYAAYTLIARPLRVPAGMEPWVSPLAGLVTGLITGGTGVFVIPAVPYLQALGLNKDDLVQALGLSFTVSTVALAAGLGWHGAFRVENLALSLVAVGPALAGMWAGQMLRNRIGPASFRRWFLICLLLLGLEMIATSVM
ncbi:MULTISPECIES: sulfite exporter TauE/SafE family protein [unclassified Chelatococcus]|uniref:sulfite exporter TauE/SafE family protein n=1 Tax=unclassified Chelatococcus TaxID=2638111 RepID=UPI001BCEBA8D|nr:MULTISPECIES: sulfite exporter TauE/SafE family protein [unclassified Chelatococcus]MBS7700713.1 sulfite exporter TauE/SafE family protein [Chelatococcus sp. YT9]MBX3559297.1 sulfite exporter TauE/SafE family protein [Chelatococcus sp.]